MLRLSVSVYFPLLLTAGSVESNRSFLFYRKFLQHISGIFHDIEPSYHDGVPKYYILGGFRCPLYCIAHDAH
jgi:hypothetical protein